MLELMWISNLTFEPFLSAAVRQAFAPAGEKVSLNAMAYEAVAEEGSTLEKADLIAVCLNFEGWYPNAEIDLAQGKITRQEMKEDAIARCKALLQVVRGRTQAKILWFGFEDTFSVSSTVYGQVPWMGGLVDEINLKMVSLLTNEVFLDLKKLIGLVGIRNAYSVKGRYRWNAPYSRQLTMVLAEELWKQYRIMQGKTPKCLVLDCDNVLWGGILSDDGIGGIWLGSEGLGREYQEFQRFVHLLWLHGVIITICSKNNEEDVRHAFREHGGMLLREEQVACFQCNWNPKAGNIFAIAEKLNIGPADMVFVDDSIFEVEAVKAQIPEIKTILYERDTIYEKMACFCLRASIDLCETQLRTQTYQSNEKRAMLRQQAVSFEDYVASLDMKLDIHETTVSESARMAELSQRTNKCTNGTRYTKEQIQKKIASAGYSLYTVCLLDRFSDLGIIGALGIHDGEIDLFSLSCRALGRGVEERILEFAVSKKAEKIKFSKTTKNEWLLPLLLKWEIQLTTLLDEHLM